MRPCRGFLEPRRSLVTKPHWPLRTPQVPDATGRGPVFAMARPDVVLFPMLAVPDLAMLNTTSNSGTQSPPQLRWPIRDKALRAEHRPWKTPQPG